ncbi:MAG TPA: hypothetical protein VF618_19015 [Thermoanaerobaculia bacterium]
MHQAVDVLQRAEQAPVSPINTTLPPKLRRELRRGAARLRKGEMQPRYVNLHSAEQLADIYERTARRDEILDGVRNDLRRIARDLKRILDTNGDEVMPAIQAVLDETRRLAEEGGPGSEAAQRYRFMQFLGWSGRQDLMKKRRKKASVPVGIPVIGDFATEARYTASAAEVLPSGPSEGEAVFTIPPDGSDFGQGRVFIRIGTGAQRWVGSFARGHGTASTIAMMPGDQHLFVSAAGAGYIIEAASRTLVETSGTKVRGVMGDAARTLFIVSHDNIRLEAFGPSGRLWKTEALGCGGFRRMTLTGTELRGEAWQARGEWAGFSVKLATGVVEGDGD